MHSFLHGHPVEEDEGAASRGLQRQGPAPRTVCNTLQVLCSVLKKEAQHARTKRKCVTQAWGERGGGETTLAGKLSRESLEYARFPNSPKGVNTLQILCKMIMYGKK